MTEYTLIAALGLSMLMFAGCAENSTRAHDDPVDAFIRKMDAAPPEQRVPDWETTRRLMLRPGPRVGDPAPDFTLPTPAGGQRITRSKFQAGRPLVLVFGSFT